MSAITFIGDGASASANEATIIADLTGDGHTVTYRQDTATATLPGGTQLLMTGPEGSGSGIDAWTASAITAAIPIFSMTHTNWSDMGLNTSTTGTSTATMASGDVETHPIITLLGWTPGGSKTLFSASIAARLVPGTTNLGTGNVTKVIGNPLSSANEHMVALESGAIPAAGSGTVNSRRVAWGPSSAGWAASRTTDAQSLLRKAVRWALGENPDTTGPTVAITNPSEAEDFSGTVTLQGTASDASGVSSARFNIDGGGNLTASLVSGNWEYSLDTTLLTDGAHTMTFTAVDTLTNSATTATRNFTVTNGGGDTTDPGITLILPAEGDLVSGTLTLRASASDDVAVDSVHFNIDEGSDIAASEVGDFWEASYDSTLLTNATHAITATAIDTSDNEATTDGVAFEVDNTITPDPPTSLIRIGNADVLGIFMGDQEVIRVYQGAELLWGLPPIVDPGPATSSFGPNGTHWYENTAPEDEWDNQHVVACTWGAIAAQLATCHTSHIGAACQILVTAGTLAAGAGAGNSSDAGVISGGVGSRTRTNRVLVMPQSGYGTVVLASGGNGTALVGVHQTVFHKLDWGPATLVYGRNSEGLSFGYSKMKRFLFTANGGFVGAGVDLAEIVLGPAQVNGVGYDRSEFKTASSGTITRQRNAGVYWAPHYKPDGSSAHCDARQYEAVNGGGAISGIIDEDCVTFRSADQGIQSAGASFIHMKHSLYLGKDQTLDRYPMYVGGDAMTLDNVLNGSATVGLIEDCYVGGSISSWTFGTITNSKSETGESGFTNFPEMDSWDESDLDALSTYPDDTYLDSIWG